MAESEIKITAKTEEAEASLATLGEKVKQLDERFLGLGDAIGTLGAAVVAGGLTEMLKGSIEGADAMGRMAEKEGVAVESFSRLSVAAKMADVDTQSLASAMGKLDKNMVSAQDGTGTAAQAFAALGISVADANGKLKSGDQVMAEVADKFHDTADGAGKTAAAMAIFGKAGAEMIPMLNGGSEELDKFGKLSDQLGLTLDGKTSAGAKAVNDNFKTMGLAMQGIGMNVMKELLPGLTNMSETLVDAATNSGVLTAASDVLGFALKGVVTVIDVGLHVTGYLGAEIVGLAKTASAVAHGHMDEAAAIWHQMDIDASVADSKFGEQLKKMWDGAEAKHKEAEEKAKKPQLDFQPGGAGGNNDQQVLDAAKKLDAQMEASHEDAFIKQIEKWKETQDQLVALGAAGAEALKQHEAAYTVFVNDENNKRNAAAKAHLDQQLAGEQDYFAKTAAAAAQYNTTAKQREDKAFADQMIDFNKRANAAAADHTLTLAEQRGFEQARDDLITAYQNKQMHDENSVVNVAKLLRAGDYQDAMTMAAAMSAGLASHSRAMFEVNKIASLANATIKGYQSIVDAFQYGANQGGPIEGAITAAIAAMFVDTQIQQINSTSFGGGGSISTGGGSIPSAALTPGVPVNTSAGSGVVNTQGVATPQQSVVNLTIAGAQNPDSPQFSYNQIVNELVPLLNQAGANGVKINVATA